MLNDIKRGRVGETGLHGKSPHEIGLAIALQDMHMTLPDMERACVTYRRPDVEPVHDWKSVPVEPFMGDKFDAYQADRFDGVFLRVTYTWDGSRYVPNSLRRSR